MELLSSSRPSSLAGSSPSPSPSPSPAPALALSPSSFSLFSRFRFPFFACAWQSHSPMFHHRCASALLGFRYRSSPRADGGGTAPFGFVSGNAVLRGWNRARGLQSRAGSRLGSEFGGARRRCCSPGTGGLVRCCSSEAEKRPRLAAARVVYGVAPAMGHNQESHPESHFRVPAIVTALEKMELTPKARGDDIVELPTVKPASVDDLLHVHTRAYVSGLEKAMDKATEKGIIYIEGSGPTYATATTFQESLVAAGVGMALVDAVVDTSRITQNPPMAFALIRPPGHHAIPKGPMGFCVFGNIAIAARYAQRVHGLKRVFIIDFDVHHGNGTNDAFYDDPDIFFLSTHQDGSYPGTGKIDEIGVADGEGTTLNLPLPGGSGDIAMRTVFDEVIAPCAQRFKPDIILVSAGYDAHVLDPLASLQFTTGTYYALASNIKQLAKELCGGRCIFFLEGGYNLQSLSYSVADTFRAFLGEPSLASKFDDPAILYEEPLTKVKQAIQRAKHLHSL